MLAEINKLYITVIFIDFFRILVITNYSLHFTYTYKLFNNLSPKFTNLSVISYICKKVHNIHS